MLLFGRDLDWWLRLAEEASTGRQSQSEPPPPAPESAHPPAFESTTTGASSLACDEVEPETPDHSNGCACVACALPGIVGLEAQDPWQEAPGARAAAAQAQAHAGPDEAVIASSVVLSQVPDTGIGIAYGDTFKLHSNPGARHIVYLDFDGHTTTGTSWNSYWNTTSINSPAFTTDSSASFSASELLAIQRIWQRVAEYFSPFNINVTTQDPGVDALRFSGSTDQAFGIRVVITDEGGKNFGGIAYTGSFDWGSDTPAFVYANRLGDGVKAIADAAAHEVGHTLGLSHDGVTVSGTRKAYYYGHGSGVTDWAPVMGVGYNANIVQWSKGEYTGATTLQDDLAIITTQNSGVTYRADDWGNSFTTAGSLAGTEAAGVVTVRTFGVITGSGTRNDVDMFRFDVAAGGSLDLTVSSWSRAYVSGSAAPIYSQSPFTMMDVSLSLYDGARKLIQTVNEATTLGARVVANGLAGGTYYIAIDGVGFGTPMATTPTGYTEYGSLGQYMVTGSYTRTLPQVSLLAEPVAASEPTATEPAAEQQQPATEEESTPTPPPPPTLSVDRATLVTAEGESQTVVVRADDASAEVVVAVSGLNAAQGQLSASSLVLNADNDWTATLTVTGLADRNVDGDQRYTLSLAAEGANPVTVAVTHQDDDVSAATGGSVFGTYVSAPAALNMTVRAQAADDNTSFSSLREGITEAGAGIEVRWQFTRLTPGDKMLQVDARSSTETFRFEYSVDDGDTWQRFLDAPEAALRWNGEFLATGVGDSLWVRLVDHVVAGDSSRDAIVLDLLTLSNVQTAGIDALI